MIWDIVVESGLQLWSKGADNNDIDPKYILTIQPVNGQTATNKISLRRQDIIVNADGLIS